MPVPGLTPKRIRDIKPKKRAFHIAHHTPKGLTLKVAPSGRKTFVVNVTRRGARHVETIGEADRMTLREAKALARERIARFTQLRDPGADTPFETVADLVFGQMELQWKPTTIASNRWYLDNFIKPYFKGRTLESITRRDVEEWFASLSDRQGGANRTAPILSVIMREAEEMGLRPEGSNPVPGLRRYRRPKVGRVLTADEMARLGAALKRRKRKQPMQVAFVLLLLLTGCRRGELNSLDWRDYRDGKLHLPDSKTGPRTIFLCEHARAVLDGINVEQRGKVFPPLKHGKNHMYIHPFWESIRHETGLDGIRIHDLRHNYATVAVRMGESLSVIGELLGHRKPDTTLEYAQLDDGMMQEAVDKVSGALATNGKGEDQ